MGEGGWWASGRYTQLKQFYSGSGLPLYMPEGRGGGVTGSTMLGEGEGVTAFYNPLGDVGEGTSGRV